MVKYDVNKIAAMLMVCLDLLEGQEKQNFIDAIERAKSFQSIAPYIEQWYIEVTKR